MGKSPSVFDLVIANRHHPMAWSDICQHMAQLANCFQDLASVSDGHLSPQSQGFLGPLKNSLDSERRLPIRTDSNDNNNHNVYF